MRGQEHYRERDENTYDIAGEMKLNDFYNLTNFSIEDPRMTTIGGVAFRHLDRLPEVGDSISVEGIAIKVLKMDGHRVSRVRVSRRGAESDDAGKAEPLDDNLNAAASADDDTDAAGHDAARKSGTASGDDKAKDKSKAKTKTKNKPAAAADTEVVEASVNASGEVQPADNSAADRNQGTVARHTEN